MFIEAGSQSKIRIYMPYPEVLNFRIYVSPVVPIFNFTCLNGAGAKNVNLLAKRSGITCGLTG
jgi:hypothetical protein